MRDWARWATGDEYIKVDDTWSIAAETPEVSADIAALANARVREPQQAIQGKFIQKSTPDQRLIRARNTLTKNAA